MLSKNLTKLRKGFTLIEIMIVVLIIGILLAIALPNFVRARESARAKSCSANLKQITSAKTQYAMDKKLVAGGTVLLTDITGASSYIASTPACPSNGTYTIGVVDADPSCSANLPAYPHTVTGQ